MGGTGARIRLARFGKRNTPFYNIVVLDRRKARNAQPIEVLGTYDPIPKKPLYGNGRPAKDVRIDLARARYWLGVGAQPSDTMWRLLSMVGLLAPKFRAGTRGAAAETEGEGALRQDQIHTKESHAAEVPGEVAGGVTAQGRDVAEEQERRR